MKKLQILGVCLKNRSWNQSYFYFLHLFPHFRAPSEFSIIYLQLIYLHKDLRRMELLCFHGIFLCYELLQLFSWKKVKFCLFVIVVANFCLITILWNRKMQQSHNSNQIVIRMRCGFTFFIQLFSQNLYIGSGNLGSRCTTRTKEMGFLAFKCSALAMVSKVWTWKKKLESYISSCLVTFSSCVIHNWNI